MIYFPRHEKSETANALHLRSIGSAQLSTIYFGMFRFATILSGCFTNQRYDNQVNRRARVCPNAGDLTRIKECLCPQSAH